MTTQVIHRLSAEQLASLLRSAAEAARCESRRAAPDEAGAGLLAELSDELRTAAQAEFSSWTRGNAVGVRPEPQAVTGGGGLAEVQRQRAALELRVQEATARISDLEAALRRERDALREAEETLALQQRKLRELQEERGRLNAEFGRVETQLREQIALTEQAEARYLKLKAGRQEASGQSLELIEQANALRAANERLREELAAALKQRDEHSTQASQAVAAVSAATPEAVLSELWRGWSQEMPEVFADTHVATRQTFEQLGVALLELLRIFGTLELHVRQMLKDLRRLDDDSDKLNHFFLLFTRSAGMQDLLREYLTTGRKKSDLLQLLRALQAWGRALASGLYKTIVKSPDLIGDALNYRNWPSKAGWATSSDAAIGKYFRETVLKSVPMSLGTDFRRLAGELAYEDYNTLVKRPK